MRMYQDSTLYQIFHFIEILHSILVGFVNAVFPVDEAGGRAEGKSSKFHRFLTIKSSHFIIIII